jgi:predicted AlkP superfamily pyrophosphatase or phosphodiesterase
MVLRNVTALPVNTASSILRAVILFLVCAGLLAGCITAARSPDREPKAVFIIIDGIPADVLERTATPELDAISAEGGYTRAFVGGRIGAASESPTVSAVGYNSLLTGTWSNKHNVWDNSVENPNYDYWDIFRIAKAHDPALKTAIFSTWTDNRTKLIGDGLDAAGGNKLDYHFDGFELDTERFPHDENDEYIMNIDAIVADEAARYLRENGSDLSWVYLQYTDDVGHRYGDGPEMTAAVRLMDEQVGAIWRSISDRGKEHDEDWLLLVTTDHGRDAETGKEHGGQSERERTIWIVTNSKRLNAHFDETPGIVDILPSIAAHLELEIPESIRRQLDGRSFIDGS